ncbi:hypothetical protein [Cruoricaptor ignavus]|uniref:hypothetical protein n=1 Tax=Cruoricaptor ignavus TaxID=1118202 RepID=UPI0011606601|nr:hypothetical protein [Cruoricaptor ignavus]
MIKYHSGKSKRAFGTYSLVVNFNANEDESNIKGVRLGGNFNANRAPQREPNRVPKEAPQCNDYYKHKQKQNNVLLEKEPKEGDLSQDEFFEILQDDLSGKSQKGISKRKKVARKKEKVFVVPEVAEVQAYCNERNNGISAEAFCAHYQSKGWVIGKNKMKDWQAAVRTWEQRRKEENEKRVTKNGGANGNKISGTSALANGAEYFEFT